MHPAGFETTIPAVERLRTYDLGHRTTGIGPDFLRPTLNMFGEGYKQVLARLSTQNFLFRL